MNVWELIVQQPVTNVLILFTHYLANSLGLAIIAMTIVVNLLMLPLTQRQIHSTKAMQEIQPKLLEIQKKYARDRQKLAEEQMRLYREAGMNPIGCLGPMVVQMPIWIALYQAIMLSLAVAPEGLLTLSRLLYSWPVLFSSLPLHRSFFGLDLGSPNFVLAILVGGTMWVQQKMSTPTIIDPRQAAQNRMMLWMMPLMFAFLALSFSSGLSLFWVTSSIVRIAIQYRATGWGPLLPNAPPPPKERGVRFIQPETKGGPAAKAGPDATVPPDEENIYGQKKKGFFKRLPWQDRARSKPK